MSEAIVRRAKTDDLSTITSLWKEMMDYHLSLDERFDMSADCHDEYLEYLRSIMENYDYAIFVAEKDRKVVGYTIGMILNNPAVFSLSRYGFIAEMAVSEQYQKSGFGHQLWNHVRRWFHRRGIKVIQLNVSPRNERGYNFWKKVGCSEFLHIMWHDIPKDI